MRDETVRSTIIPPPWDTSPDGLEDMLDFVPPYDAEAESWADVYRADGTETVPPPWR